MTQETYKKISIATLITMASIFLSRIIGYFREVIIARVAGADATVDAYRVAFVLPDILNHILASGFLSVTFIPIFSKYLVNNDEKGAWRIFSIILTTFGTFLALLIIASMIFTPQIVSLLAAGRKDPQFLELATHMTRIILPAQFFFFVGSLMMAVQYSKERFLIPALATLIYNLGIISGGLILGPRIGIEGFSWGVLIGAFLGNFIIQIFGARKIGLRFRPQFNLKNKDLRHYFLLSLPFMIGLTMIFSMEILSKFFGSYLPEGGIAWLDYAKFVMMILPGFFGQAMGVASYPYLARLAAEERWNEMNRIFNNLLRYIGTLVIPSSVLMFILRYEIIRVLFEGGKFLTEDTGMTALALSGLLIGAVAIAAQMIVNRGFYAMQNTLLPTVYNTIAVLISLPVYYLGLKMYGLIGVALAMSISAIIQVWVIYVIWNRRSHNTESIQVYKTYLLTAIASLPLGSILWVTHYFMSQHINSATKLGSIIIIAIVSMLFILLMALGGWFFKVEGIQYIGNRVIRRLKRT